MKRNKFSRGMIRLRTPIDGDQIKKLRVGDHVEINGKIYCGRDAVLPRLASLVGRGDLGRIRVDLEGSVIFHTAVSPAGIGPTTSNKVEIQGSMPTLSKAGVRIHLGKGSLSPKTIEELKRNNSVFAITPPVTALFSDHMISQRIVAFREEGMEALHEVEVRGFPAIIAIAHGKSLFALRRVKGQKDAHSKKN